MRFLEELASRRRFGMKPGLETIRALCSRMGDPQRNFPAIHVAGTNGKGAVCALLEAALLSSVKSVGRYTSPHLVRLNERFFLNGCPVDDATLEALSSEVSALAPADLTFFEALTAVAFLLYSRASVDYAVLECGLGGRLDATNICSPVLSVITRIGLDHCDWLGDTLEKIAAEKAGIIKAGVPVVLGHNEPVVRSVIEARAKEVGAPFVYAPELACEDEIPSSFSLPGSFNRENAVTALAALRTLGFSPTSHDAWWSHIVWPGRFQEVGSFLIDGAHNPPAAHALVHALAERFPDERVNLIFGACGDKDISTVLAILAPQIARAWTVKTTNPRSLAPEDLANRLRAAGIPAIPLSSLSDALNAARAADSRTLICGSLFLAGEALVALNAYPWPIRFDPSELLCPTQTASLET